MYKVVGLLKRPEGMQMEDFRRWRLEVHAPSHSLSCGSLPHPRWGDSRRCGYLLSSLWEKPTYQMCMPMQVYWR